MLVLKHLLESLVFMGRDISRATLDESLTSRKAETRTYFFWLSSTSTLLQQGRDRTHFSKGILAGNRTTSIPSDNDRMENSCVSAQWGY